MLQNYKTNVDQPDNNNYYLYFLFLAREPENRAGSRTYKRHHTWLVGSPSRLHMCGTILLRVRPWAPYLEEKEKDLEMVLQLTGCPASTDRRWLDLNFHYEIAMKSSQQVWAWGLLAGAPVLGQHCYILGEEKEQQREWLTCSAWQWDKGTLPLWCGCSCAWSHSAFGPTRTATTQHTVVLTLDLSAELYCTVLQKISHHSI